MQLITLTVMNLIINFERLFLGAITLSSFRKDEYQGMIFFFSLCSVDAAQYDVKLS